MIKEYFMQILSKKPLQFILIKNLIQGIKCDSY